MSSQETPSLFSGGTLSVITFSTMDATFAIPLDQIRYIEKDVERNIRVDRDAQFNHEVITFQQRAVPLYDFAHLTGSKAASETSEETIKLLADREQDHVEWMAALEDSLAKQTSFSKSLDPAKCAFGKWLAHFETADGELSEIIKRFDEPHRRLHALAGELLEQSKTDQAGALASLNRERKGVFSQLLRVFERATEHIQASFRPIIVFVEHRDNRVSALRLDNIRDIEIFRKDDFSRDESIEGMMKRKSEDFRIEGYLRNGDKPPYILINCR